MKVYKCDNCGKEININNSSYFNFLDRLQNKDKVKNDDILISVSVKVFDGVDNTMKPIGYQQISTYDLCFDCYKELIRNKLKANKK